MSRESKITKNVLWLAGEYSVKMIAGLAVAGVVARSLGVEQYGQFQYTLGLVTVFMSLSFVCSAEVLVPRFVHMDEEKSAQLIGSAYWLRLFFSIFSYSALLLYVAAFESKSLLALAAILGCQILLNEPFAVVTAWLQAQTMIKAKAKLAGVAAVIKLAVVFLMVYFINASSNFLGLAWVIECLVMALGLVIIYRGSTGNGLFQVSLSDMRDLLRSGLPFMVGLILSYIYLRLDLIILKRIGQAHDVGIYSASVQVMLALNAFAPILTMSMAPTMVYRHNDIRIIRENLKRMTLFMMAACTLGAVALSIVAPIAVPLIFGGEFEDAVGVLRVLSFASLFLFVENSLNVYLIKFGKGNLIAIKWLLAIVILVATSIVAIPTLGAYGAVLGYLLGYVGASGFILLCVWKIE